MQKSPSNKWSIGGRYINYYVSRFNYEDNTVLFYSDEEFVFDENYDEFGGNAKGWIIFTIVILILGIGLLLYIRNYEKKNEGLLDFE